MKKTKRSSIIRLIVIVLCTVLWIAPNRGRADDWYEENPGYFTVYDESGKELFAIGSEIFEDDEYISEDNKRYRIIEVDPANKTGKARFMEEVKLLQIPVEGTALEALANLQQQKLTIGLYNTHSDESYIPSDGVASKKASGGIFDVSEAFGKELEKRGINVVVDKTPHDPHDAGAYRRSRRTALRLIEDSQATTLFDIHRDAVPAKQYTKEIAGQPASKVRIVIGRRNQNREANEALAYRIKAIADKKYPGLIKDIFLGRGNYNQEIIPRALLFEFGTYKISKERAIKSTGPLAEVVATALLGESAKAAPQTTADKDVPGTETRQTTPMDGDNRSAGRGIFWVIAIALIGGIGFLVISSGGKEMWSKLSKTGQEFSSYLGRYKNKRK